MLCSDCLSAYRPRCPSLLQVFSCFLDCSAYWPRRLSLHQASGSRQPSLHIDSEVVPCNLPCLIEAIMKFFLASGLGSRQPLLHTDPEVVPCNMPYRGRHDFCNMLRLYRGCHEFCFRTFLLGWLLRCSFSTERIRILDFSINSLTFILWIGLAFCPRSTCRHADPAKLDPDVRISRVIVTILVKSAVDGLSKIDMSTCQSGQAWPDLFRIDMSTCWSWKAKSWVILFWNPYPGFQHRFICAVAVWRRNFVQDR